MERSQSSSEQPWREGHCTIGPAATASTGSFRDAIGSLRRSLRASAAAFENRTLVVFSQAGRRRGRCRH